MYKELVKKGILVGIAVALVVGLAFKGFVTSFISGVIYL
tara:strand:- start:923 stop:1039 length:117 start_codon:yes stop_codon:yes gene_type:complete